MHLSQNFNGQETMVLTSPNMVIISSFIDDLFLIFKIGNSLEAASKFAEQIAADRGWMMVE